MNKNVKKIVAVALAVGTISAVAPATNVYASDDNTETQVDSFELETSSGSNIKLYDDDGYDSDDKVDKEDIDEGETYYAKTSSSKIKVNIDGIDDKYIKVFTSDSDSAKGKDVDDDISISSDKTIYVKIYDSEPDSNVRYDNEDEDAEDIGEYKIEVEYTGDDSDDSDDEDDSDDADDYDDIYLDKLTVDGESIALSDSKVTYAYDVANNVSSVVIKALPENEDDDDVTIDGIDVDDSDNFKRTVSLTTGVNKIEIEVENDDDDEDRTYTLNITRAAAAVAATNTATAQPATATAVVNTAAKTTGWAQVNGTWQYHDSLGNSVKNWFFDKNYGKWYFLGADGNMQTGWILNGGQYYYLNSDGSMASNTTINGYKVGTNGAWIR